MAEKHNSGAYEFMDKDKMMAGGFVNWKKYPEKKVLGLYEIKGNNIDSKVNIIMFENYDDDFYDLYPLEKDRNLFKAIRVKSNSLNLISKGSLVKGELNDGTNVKIKRIGNLDYSV